MKKVTDRGKRSNTQNEVKPVKNISKGPEIFLEVSPSKRKLFLHINYKTMHISNRSFHVKSSDNPGKFNLPSQK